MNEWMKWIHLQRLIFCCYFPPQSSSVLMFWPWRKKLENTLWEFSTRPSACCGRYRSPCCRGSQQTLTCGLLESSVCPSPDWLTGKMFWCQSLTAERSSFRYRGTEIFLISEHSIETKWQELRLWYLTFCPAFSGSHVQLLFPCLLWFHPTFIPWRGEQRSCTFSLLSFCKPIRKNGYTIWF